MIKDIMQVLHKKLDQAHAPEGDHERLEQTLGNPGNLSRRLLLKTLGYGSAGLSLPSLVLPSTAQAGDNEIKALSALPGFTGPTSNPYWNSVGRMVTYPQKRPLILLTDRPVQLETPRYCFQEVLTANDAFFVRWHLDGIPNSVDLASFRLNVTGHVDQTLSLSMKELIEKFTAVSVTAVCQCAGNSRSRFSPRVPGGQWGHGAMGNATWTGVKLRDILNIAKIKAGSIQVQFQGLDRGKGPEGKGSYSYMKSIPVEDASLDQCIVAYLMNGEPLPMLNGFPVRLVVPGKFATYWVKALSDIRLVTEEDKNFWMHPAYQIPDTPRGHTTPEDVKEKRVTMKPIITTDMPIRSFLITPENSTKLVAGLPVTLKGIAFSGASGVKKVEVSLDDGKSWQEAKLGEDLGVHSFRLFTYTWTPIQPGRYPVAIRATDLQGVPQSDEAVWNPSGYLWNKTERETLMVGSVG